MAALGSNDPIAANQEITITYSAILGPLTSSSQIQQGIAQAFAGTTFVIDSLSGPFSNVMDIIEPTVVNGHFSDVDGGGHSVAGGNYTESQVEQFFLQYMAGVPGLYEVAVDSIQAYTSAPSTPLTTTSWMIIAAMAVVGLVALAVVSKEV